LINIGYYYNFYKKSKEGVKLISILIEIIIIKIREIKEMMKIK
jgi:hypothetical protein